MSEGAELKVGSSATNVQSEKDVPSGYEVQWSGTGVPFFAKIKGGDGAADDEDAANEHVVESLPFRISFDEIEKQFGIGTRVYWHFLTFIIVTNGILAFVMGISYLQFLTKERQPSARHIHCFESAAPYFFQYVSRDDTVTAQLLLTGDVKQEMTRDSTTVIKGLTFAELFISAFTAAHKSTWLAMSSIGIILQFSFPAAFYFYIKKRVLGRTQNEYDNPFAFSGLEHTKISGNEHYTEFNRTLRIFGSALVFSSLLIISGVIIFFLQTANQDLKSREDVDKFKIASINYIDVLCTLTVTLINMFFGTISKKLTEMEKHLTWAAYRRSHVIKLYAFKLLNVCALYVAVGLVSAQSACPFFDQGRKFLVLILSEMIVGNLVELLVPQFKLRVLPVLSARFRGSGSDESLKPEFDLAEEYLELLYRQFIVYIGMAVFPLLPLLGFVTNLIEYPIDKLRMTKICQRPKRLDITMKKMLSIFLLTNAIVATFLPVVGNVFLLAGVRVSKRFADPKLCALFHQPTAEAQFGLPLVDRSSSSYPDCFRSTACVQPLFSPICKAIESGRCQYATELKKIDASCRLLALNLLAPNHTQRNDSLVLTASNECRCALRNCMALPIAAGANCTNDVVNITNPTMIAAECVPPTGASC